MIRTRNCDVGYVFIRTACCYPLILLHNSTDSAMQSHRHSRSGRSAARGGRRGVTRPFCATDRGADSTAGCAIGGHADHGAGVGRSLERGIGGARASARPCGKSARPTLLHRAVRLQVGRCPGFWHASCYNLRSEAMTMNAPRGQAGMTLVELMVVLSIVGILGMLAIPSFKNFLPRVRLNSNMMLPVERGGGRAGPCDFAEHRLQDRVLPRPDRTGLQVRRLVGEPGRHLPGRHRSLQRGGLHDGADADRHRERPGQRPAQHPGRHRVPLAGRVDAQAAPRGAHRARLRHEVGRRRLQRGGASCACARTPVPRRRRASR